MEYLGEIVGFSYGFQCDQIGTNTLTVLNKNVKISNTRAIADFEVYQANNHFLTYGMLLGSEICLPNGIDLCSSEPQEFGFGFSYFDTVYSSGLVCMNGSLLFSVINSDQIEPLLDQSVTVTSSGNVCYRTVTDENTVDQVNSVVRQAYSTGSGFEFNATGIFLITWNSVIITGSSWMKENVQLALVTDGYYAFFIYIYGSNDAYSNSGFKANGQAATFTGSNSTSNVGMAGVWFYKSFGQSRKTFLNIQNDRIDLIVFDLLLKLKPSQSLVPQM